MHAMHDGSSTYQLPAPHCLTRGLGDLHIAFLPRAQERMLARWHAGELQAKIMSQGESPPCPPQGGQLLIPTKQWRRGETSCLLWCVRGGKGDTRQGPYGASRGICTVRRARPLG